MRKQLVLIMWCVIINCYTINAVQEPQEASPNCKKMLAAVSTGLGAGSLEVTLSQVLVYWKNRRELKLPISYNPKEWYRGYPINLCSAGLLTALQTGSYQVFETTCKQWNMPQATTLAALSCGAASGLIGSPAELFIIRMQKNKTKFMYEFRSIYKEGGIRGFSRGMCPGILIYSLLAEGYLDLGPRWGELLHKNYIENKTFAEFLGNISAGVGIAVAFQPFDVVKTYMQTDVAKQKYKGMFQTAQKLYAQEETYKIFQRGLLPSIIRIIFAVTLQAFLTKSVHER